MSIFFNVFKPKAIDYNGEKMAELTPDLYQELLRYKIQDENYFHQPIDLSTYRRRKQTKEVA